MSKTLSEVCLDHVRISWYEQQRKSYCKNSAQDEIGILFGKAFDFLDEFRKRNNPQYDPENQIYSDMIKNDRVIIFSSISCDKGYENNKLHVLKTLVDYFNSNDNTIIMSIIRILKLSDMDIEEEYVDIPDEITDKAYQISNYGNVLDDNGEIVHQIYFEDGPRIPIISDNGNNVKYYSVPLIMVKAFNPSAVSNINIKMAQFGSMLDNLVNLYKDSGFVRVNNYHIKIIGYDTYIYPSSNIQSHMEYKLADIISKENVKK